MFTRPEFNQLIVEETAYVQRQPPRPGGRNAYDIFGTEFTTLIYYITLT